MPASTLSFTRMMETHYGKPVILLIDEYDIPLAKANEEKEVGERYYGQMLDVIRGIMSTALKSNDYLKFAVVTGCLRIAKESIFTGVNNFASYSVLDEKRDTFREWYDSPCSAEILIGWAMRRDEMEIVEMLDVCAKMANRDAALRREFLATRQNEHPVDAFCRICRRLGFPVYPMDLIAAGEDSYAAMKRSTNGGGENSPMLEGEDDFYELFLAGLSAPTGQSH